MSTLAKTIFFPISSSMTLMLAGIFATKMEVVLTPKFVSWLTKQAAKVVTFNEVLILQADKQTSSVKAAAAV